MIGSVPCTLVGTGNHVTYTLVTDFGHPTGGGVVNGLDVQQFTQVLRDPYAVCVQFSELCAADLNADGSVTSEDMDSFVYALLNP